jgi:hypothetical protein
VRYGKESFIAVESGPQVIFALLRKFIETVILSVVFKLMAHFTVDISLKEIAEHHEIRSPVIIIESHVFPLSGILTGGGVISVFTNTIGNEGSNVVSHSFVSVDAFLLLEFCF